VVFMGAQMIEKVTDSTRNQMLGKSASCT